MIAQAEARRVAPIGLPRIGAGLAGLDWPDVARTLEAAAAGSGVRWPGAGLAGRITALSLRQPAFPSAALMAILAALTVALALALAVAIPAWAAPAAAACGRKLASGRFRSRPMTTPGLIVLFPQVSG